MRVLHLSAGSLWGGLERGLVTLAEERAFAPDMHPHFAVCFRGRFSHELRMSGVPVDYLGEVRFSRPLTVLRARRALRAVLSQERIDVGVCHLPWAHALFAPVLEAARVPVVFWMHGFATGHHWTERWARLSPPALTIANSRATAETAPRLFPQTRTEVLYLPVRPSEEPRAEAPGSLLQVSRMERWKGHRFLFQALLLLKDEPGWHCRILGGAQTAKEAAYLSGLQDSVRSLGLSDRVEFLGQQFDVEEHLAAASIFCQPNVGPEPFGVAAVEALAAGVPVVATRLGAAPEIVDPSCGILCDPGDPGAFAAALRALLRDPALRAQLGAAGPARAASLCDPAQQVAALAALLRTVTLKSQEP